MGYNSMMVFYYNIFFPQKMYSVLLPCVLWYISFIYLLMTWLLWKITISLSIKISLKKASWILTWKVVELGHMVVLICVQRG